MSNLQKNEEDMKNEDVDFVSFANVAPIEDMYFSLEHDHDLKSKLHLFKNIDETIEQSIQVDEPTVVSEVEEPIDAPTGLKVQ
jgi:hypothetical protein